MKNKTGENAPKAERPQKGMTQDARWRYEARLYLGFYRRNGRRPSRHVAREVALYEWYHYNRKRLSRGKMEGKRAEAFRKLTAACPPGKTGRRPKKSRRPEPTASELADRYAEDVCPGILGDDVRRLLSRAFLEGFYSARVREKR